MTDDHPLLIISGPTAGGKTDLAIQIARELKGEIINIDSVQLYRGLDIGSAKPSLEARQDVPHHLFDIFEPSESTNVAGYRSLAVEAIKKIRGENRPVILVGGSTLYITCLLQGLEDLPPASKEFRSKLDEMSSEELHAKLLAVDSETAERVSPQDRVRMIRALEAFMVAGRQMSVARKEHNLAARPPYRAVVIVPCWKRSDLYSRINYRSQEMVRAGIVGETKRIIERYGDVPILRSLGYAQAREHLNGTIRLEDLPDVISLFTRRFAKRQMTYWRNEPLKRGWEIRPAAGDSSAKLLDEDGQRVSRHTKSKSFSVLTWDWDKLRGEIGRAIAKPLEKTEIWYLDATRFK